MHRDLTSAQLTEVRAYARIDAVPDSEIEQGDRRNAKLDAQARSLFTRMIRNDDRSDP